jgi:tRNA pseudouridine55 synthase
VLLSKQTAQTFQGGYINVNKPRDWTSTDVVRKLKRVTGVKKIGHGGTLDPIATGVLPVCLGPGTRFAEMVLLGTKEYRITVTLGTATDTYDSEGQVTEEAEWSGLTRADAAATLEQFRGEFDQTPPMYSAVKHQGQRLYELARKGIEVERKTRRVEVKQLDLLRWEPPELELHVECSHGFYARSLANDFGKALGSAAHLSGLVRTRAGLFRIEEAHTVEEIEQRAAEGEWQDFLLPVDFTLQHMPSVKLNPLTEESVMHGQALSVAEFGGPVAAKPGQRVRAYGADGGLVAILLLEPEKSGWRPEKVLASL